MTHANKTEQSHAAGGEERLLTRRLLRKLVPVSDMTIWRWERDGQFPRHLSVHGRNYWLFSEVQQWLAEHRRAASDIATGKAK